MTTLRGKRIALTGRLSRSRKALKTTLEALGAKITTTVSPTTDAVVAGSRAGKKLEQARALGILILDESHIDQLAAGATLENLSAHPPTTAVPITAIASHDGQPPEPVKKVAPKKRPTNPFEALVAGLRRGDSLRRLASRAKRGGIDLSGYDHVSCQTATNLPA